MKLCDRNSASRQGTKLLRECSRIQSVSASSQLQMDEVPDNLTA